jgi:hypothetical protein
MGLTGSLSHVVILANFCKFSGNAIGLLHVEGLIGKSIQIQFSTLNAHLFIIVFLATTKKYFKMKCATIHLPIPPIR